MIAYSVTVSPFNYCRLAATEVMKQLESTYEVEEYPYSRVDLIRKTGEKEANLAAQSTSLSPLKDQIEAIKVVI